MISRQNKRGFEKIRAIRGGSEPAPPVAYRETEVIRMHDPRYVLRMKAPWCLTGKEPVYFELLEAHDGFVRYVETVPGKDPVEKTANRDDLDSSAYQAVSCAILGKAYGDEFTGYAHNYCFLVGTAWSLVDGRLE